MRLQKCTPIRRCAQVDIIRLVGRIWFLFMYSYLCIYSPFLSFTPKNQHDYFYLSSLPFTLPRRPFQHYGPCAIGVASVEAFEEARWMRCVAVAEGGDTSQHNATETLVTRYARWASHRPVQMPRGGRLRARGQTYVRSC